MMSRARSVLIPRPPSEADQASTPTVAHTGPGTAETHQTTPVLSEPSRSSYGRVATMFNPAFGANRTLTTPSRQPRKRPWPLATSSRSQCSRRSPAVLAVSTDHTASLSDAGLATPTRVTMTSDQASPPSGHTIAENAAAGVGVRKTMSTCHGKAPTTEQPATAMSATMIDRTVMDLPALLPQTSPPGVESRVHRRIHPESRRVPFCSHMCRLPTHRLFEPDSTKEGPPRHSRSLSKGTCVPYSS